MTFALDLSDAIEKAKDKAELAVRGIAIDLFNDIIEMSPVAHPPSWKSVIEWEARKAAGKTKAKSPADGYIGGHFRRNWNCSIGTPDVSTTDETDASGSIAKAKVHAVVMSYKLGEQSVFLCNSLEYAQALEEGHSGQAPVGMVRVSIARMNAHGYV